ncbi:hypothetical protein [Pantoea sp.]|uniref:hypothetical protein n=1 Tax=Pantoea sp. TaxID=69393 RepID=UPI002910A4CD|nr:hypothetical protein [Pantoea sp.]MDU4127305.1 hypothetical protein [Pantoea sp.]
MNHLPADGFFMSPDPVIPPFEQAYILNKKLIDKANTLSDPVITVGGQAIQYWVAYYRELYRDALPDARLVTSVDVDYAARRHDVAAIAAALGVDPNMNEQGQPPSLARFALVDLKTQQIKNVDGRFLQTRIVLNGQTRWMLSIFHQDSVTKTFPAIDCS